MGFCLLACIARRSIPNATAIIGLGHLGRMGRWEVEDEALHCRRKRPDSLSRGFLKPRRQDVTRSSKNESQLH